MIRNVMPRSMKRRTHLLSFQPVYTVLLFLFVLVTSDEYNKDESEDIPALLCKRTLLASARIWLEYCNVVTTCIRNMKNYVHEHIIVYLVYETALSTS